MGKIGAGRIRERGMDGSRAESAAQRRLRKGPGRMAAAPEDDDDVEVDRGTA